MQALLLRFLETGEIQRVGCDRHAQTVNVRVITATHRQLLEQVAEKTFREDLFYRLNVVHIEVPPLRERREDVVQLLDYFLKMLGHASASDAGARQGSDRVADAAVTGRATCVNCGTSWNASS